MLIKIYKTIQINNCNFYPGKFYSFSYSNNNIDKDPLILFLNIHHGKHNKTNNIYYYLQGINLHYMNPKLREFIYKKWIYLNLYDKKYIEKNFYHLWKILNKLFLNNKLEIRRYLFYPNNYIYNPFEIKYDTILNYINHNNEEIKKMEYKKHKTLNNFIFIRK